jgi:hypothetical protein
MVENGTCYWIALRPMLRDLRSRDSAYIISGFFEIIQSPSLTLGPLDFRIPNPQKMIRLRPYVLIDPFDSFLDDVRKQSLITP